jgi:hypothetical protein
MELPEYTDIDTSPMTGLTFTSWPKYSSRTHFKDCTFHAENTGKVIIRDCLFTNCNFTHADISKFVIEGTTFENCNMNFICADNTRFTKCRVQDVSLEGSRIVSTEMVDSSFDNVSMLYCNPHPFYAFDNTTFTNITLGQNISGDKWRVKELYGTMHITPIGSRSDTLIAHFTSSGLLLKTGCFFGTRKSFIKLLDKTHPDGRYHEEYLLALQLVEKRRAAQFPTPFHTRD